MRHVRTNTVDPEANRAAVQHSRRGREKGGEGGREGGREGETPDSLVSLGIMTTPLFLFCFPHPLTSLAPFLPLPISSNLSFTQPHHPPPATASPALRLPPPSQAATCTANLHLGVCSSPVVHEHFIGRFPRPPVPWPLPHCIHLLRLALHLSEPSTSSRKSPMFCCLPASCRCRCAPAALLSRRRVAASAGPLSSALLSSTRRRGGAHSGPSTLA